MNYEKFTVQQVAKITGITVRTLHYYDEIDLLKPSEVTNVGYRIYNKESLERLEQILFFKELDFSLDQIKIIISNPSYDKKEILQKQKSLLQEKLIQLQTLIKLIDNRIEGTNEINFLEFKETNFDNMKKSYILEAKELYGHMPEYIHFTQKVENLEKHQWNILDEKGSIILKEFSKMIHLGCESKEAQDMVTQWKSYITENFYLCTNEILICLGLMYVEDKRFTQFIDQYGEGTAQFINESIIVYCILIDKN